jgi:hypothetical protein
VIRCVRARTYRTITDPVVRALIIRAVEATRYPGTSPEVLYAELKNRGAEEALGIFIGYDDLEPKALAVAMLPTSAFMMAPQVPLIYNGGPPALAKAVSMRLRRWLTDAGFKTVIGANLYRSNQVFMRGLSHFGKPKPLGSLIEFDLT